MSNDNSSATELSISTKDMGIQPVPEGTGNDTQQSAAETHEQTPHLLQYKKVLEHVIPIFGAGSNEHIWDKDFSTEGRFEDKTYKIRFPHLRKGKHAAVGIVDIGNLDGTTFSCVIRNSPADAMRYLQAVEHNPFVAEYSPHLYGIVDNWVVMEKLTGLELEELEEKLKTDSSFLSQYAQSAQTLISRLAAAHLTMDDVCFMDGHNTMVNPETAEIKIVEQKSIHPTSLEPNEVEIGLLFREAEAIMNKIDRANAPQHKTRLLYELLQISFQQRKPDDLYIRPRFIRPKHPDFKKEWFIQNWEELSEERYQRILADPNLRENLTLNCSSNENTEIFDLKLVETVIKGDFTAFQEVVKKGNYKSDIIDKNDPRAQEVILP